MPHNLSGDDIANRRLRSIPPYVTRECRVISYGPMLTSCSYTVAALVWVIHDYCESAFVINSYHLISLIMV